MAAAAVAVVSDRPMDGVEEAVRIGAILLLLGKRCRFFALFQNFCFAKFCEHLLLFCRKESAPNRQGTAGLLQSAINGRGQKFDLPRKAPHDACGQKLPAPQPKLIFQSIVHGITSFDMVHSLAWSLSILSAFDINFLPKGHISTCTLFVCIQEQCVSLPP